MRGSLIAYDGGIELFGSKSPLSSCYENQKFFARYMGYSIFLFASASLACC